MLFSDTMSPVSPCAGPTERTARRYRQVACNVRSFFSLPYTLVAHRESVRRSRVMVAAHTAVCVHYTEGRKTPLRVRNAGRPRPIPRSCGRRVLTPLGCRRSPPLCVSAAATGLGGGRNDWWWTLRRVRCRGDLARQSCGGRRTERYGRRCRRETVSAPILYLCLFAHCRLRYRGAFVA